MITEHPTPNIELNAVLQEFVTGAEAILGTNFLAACLQGSFAVGDWDEDSDVDFLIVTAQDVSDAELVGLQLLHGRIYDLDSLWAQHLEGSYFPKDLLKEADPALTPLWYLDNTSRELIRSPHDNTVVVRWVAREYGVTLAGPEPKLLIDPVSAEDLRREVWATMQEWAHSLFAHPNQMDNRWFQPYAVLSHCRMLHTLHTGRVGSKPAGAEWAKRTLDRRWADLISRAWGERPNPGLKVRLKANADDLESTFAFIQYALAEGNAIEGREIC